MMCNEREPSRMKTFPALSDAYYRNLCEHAGMALISTDRDLMIRSWNSAAGQMFGASASSMIGTSISSIIPKENRQEGQLLLRETLETSKIINFEFKHRDDRGRPRYLSAAFSPIIDDNGEHVGALACIRDITRRITAETRLAERNKMVSLGHLAGALAHRFNNIIGGVVTSVDFALSTNSPNLQLRALRQTDEALARAGKLVNALLTFAEGDVRHQDKCDLTEVVIDVANYVERELIAQGVKLDIVLNPVPVTPVPRDQLVTVLENLLHNAADAMPDGGEVKIESSVEDGVVALTVTDTGCGMDEASCQRVFEPFYSTKTSAAESEHHAGLGLAVAHGVLQVLGHTISISSTPGKGTTVTVRFEGKPNDSA